MELPPNYSSTINGNLLLGRGIITNYNFCLDYSKKELTLFNRGYSTRDLQVLDMTNSLELPFSLEKYGFYVTLNVKEGNKMTDFRFIMDTGVFIPSRTNSKGVTTKLVNVINYNSKKFIQLIPKQEKAAMDKYSTNYAIDLIPDYVKTMNNELIDVGSMRVMKLNFDCDAILGQAFFL